MKVFLACKQDEQAIMMFATLISPTGVRGHLRRVLRPGEDFDGWTFEELMRLGSGPHELELPRPGLTKAAS